MLWTVHIWCIEIASSNIFCEFSIVTFCPSPSVFVKHLNVAPCNSRSLSHSKCQFSVSRLTLWTKKLSSSPFQPHNLRITLAALTKRNQVLFHHQHMPPFPTLKKRMTALLSSIYSAYKTNLSWVLFASHFFAYRFSYILIVVGILTQNAQRSAHRSCIEAPNRQ